MDYRYQSPDSCYLSKTSVTIAAVAKEYATCKADIKGVVPNLNLTKQDQELQRVINQLEPNAQLNQNSKQVLEGIFTEARVAIDQHKPPIVSTARDLIIIFLFFWVMGMMLLLEAFFDHQTA